MKNSIYKILLFALVFAFALPVNAQSRKERKILYNSQYNYEIEPVGVGQDGTKVFKVWGYGKDVGAAVMNKLAQETSSANAYTHCAMAKCFYFY